MMVGAVTPPAPLVKVFAVTPRSAVVPSVEIIVVDKEVENHEEAEKEASAEGSDAIHLSSEESWAARSNVLGHSARIVEACSPQQAEEVSQENIAPVEQPGTPTTSFLLTYESIPQPSNTDAGYTKTTLNQSHKVVFENQPKLPTADARCGGRTTPRAVLGPVTFENRPIASKADEGHAYKFTRV
jgi:hypothetical protein